MIAQELSTLTRTRRRELAQVASSRLESRYKIPHADASAAAKHLLETLPEATLVTADRFGSTAVVSKETTWDGTSVGYLAIFGTPGHPGKRLSRLVADSLQLAQPILGVETILIPANIRECRETLAGLRLRTEAVFVRRPIGPSDACHDTTLEATPTDLRFVRLLVRRALSNATRELGIRRPVTTRDVSGVMTYITGRRGLSVVGSARGRRYGHASGALIALDEWGEGVLADLVDTYVLERFAGQGLSERLERCFCAIARSRGASAVEGHIVPRAREPNFLGKLLVTLEARHWREHRRLFAYDARHAGSRAENRRRG